MLCDRMRRMKNDFYILSLGSWVYGGVIYRGWEDFGGEIYCGGEDLYLDTLA